MNNLHPDPLTKAGTHSPHNSSNPCLWATLLTSSGDSNSTIPHPFDRPDAHAHKQSEPPMLPSPLPSHLSGVNHKRHSNRIDWQLETRKQQLVQGSKQSRLHFRVCIISKGKTSQGVELKDSNKAMMGGWVYSGLFKRISVLQRVGFWVDLPSSVLMTLAYTTLPHSRNLSFKSCQEVLHARLPT